MPKHSKRFGAVATRITTNRLYDPRDAVNLVKETSNAKFDETVEVHMLTNADPRHADQMVREVVVLPHGLGKQIRVLVFASGEAVDIARQAGADNSKSEKPSNLNLRHDFLIVRGRPVEEAA